MPFNPALASLIFTLSLAFIAFVWSRLPSRSRRLAEVVFRRVVFPQSDLYRHAWTVCFKAPSYRDNLISLDPVDFKRRFGTGSYQFLHTTSAYRLYELRYSNDSQLPGEGDSFWDGIIADCVLIMSVEERRRYSIDQGLLADSNALRMSSPAPITAPPPVLLRYPRMEEPLYMV